MSNDSIPVSRLDNNFRRVSETTISGVEFSNVQLPPVPPLNQAGSPSQQLNPPSPPANVSLPIPPQACSPCSATSLHVSFEDTNDFTCIDLNTNLLIENPYETAHRIQRNPLNILDLTHIQLTRMRNKEEVENIEKTWKKLLLPIWPTVSLFSSYSNLDDFIKLIKHTYLLPKEFDKVKIHHAIHRFFMHPQDIFAAKYAIQLNKERISHPITLYPNYYVGGKFVGNLGSYYADTVFVDRGLSSISKNLIKTHGPTKLLKSELTIHSATIIAPSLIVSYLFGQLSTYYTRTFETESVSKGIFLTVATFQVIQLFGLLFSILHATLQIFLCSVASIDDKLSATYLSIPIGLRFADIIVFLAIFFTIGPLTEIVNSFGNSPHTNWNYLGMITIICAILYILSLITGFAFFGCRMYYSSLKDIHGRISSPEEIQDRPTNQPGKLARFLEASFFTNHVEYNRTLSSIGSYRKRELGKRTRENIMDKIVESVMLK